MSNQGRDPAKRKVRPVESQFLLEIDLGEGESSDDSDFRIEDHAAEESDDYSINSDDDAKKDGDNSDSSDASESEDDGFKSSNQLGGGPSVTELLEKAKNQEFKIPAEYANMMICAGCLGSRSDDFNEIVECDGCGVTVHEGCYGVSDVTSESSTVSVASTEPWFCEACKAGVTEPSCELCPNTGGIFKETEVGAWVHLVCALYVPGVAFSEVERLSGVTLFEMAYSRWGARACALCEDATLARTGVAVGCDAGLCKTFFHVTCGQRCGLLAEAHSEEVEQADPFYAHCRLHSDKTLIRRRRRNWLALQLRTEHRKRELQENLTSQEKLRIQRKLVKYRRKYLQHKEHRNPPWVPTQKMARMLFSSASAMRKFQKKAEVMGVDTHALEFQDAQMAALKDVSRRWHIPPAFSVEFVGYYLERNHRVSTLRAALQSLTRENDALRAGEAQRASDYDESSKANTAALAAMNALQESTMKLYDALSALRPAPPPQLLQPPVKRALAVPTAAALKMGVGFPLSDHPGATHGKVLSTSLQASPSSLTPTEASAGGVCCVCARTAARRLLATCDSCQRHYHPACLQPPLARPPKKTKLYGWQCSECDKTSDSEPEVIEKKGPRRSRIRYSKDGAILPASPLADPTPAHAATDNLSPIKVTIKPFEFTDNDAAEKKKDKKLKKAKLKEQISTAGEIDSASKKLKRSFTSPNLTNTPLMSITPIVAESPNDSHNENSNNSTAVATKADTSFLSTNSSFSSLIGEAKEKERDSKAIETSIETTLANLSSDIATYKANRKRRKEKHRSRYSPDLLRSPTKSHKHKRKKKAHPELENPDMPHPRITIKIKPIPKPAGSTDTQMFYVPTDSNDGPPPPPPPIVRTIPKQVIEEAQREPEAIVPIEPLTADQLPKPKEDKPVEKEVTKTVVKPKSSERGRTAAARGGRGARGASRAAARDLPALTHCDVCSEPGAPANLVRCDECFKRYHLSCLEPPLNKNPKKRGYSWHCADCDPTDVEDNN